MRILMLFAALFVVICATPGISRAQGTCKECAEAQRRCMSNYAGPTCKTEYGRCMKNCKK